MRPSEILNFFDLILAPFFIFIILIIANTVKNRHIEREPIYKYYVPALFIKIIGGISVCLVYTLYYTGGDTTNFYSDGFLFNNVLFNDPAGYLYLMTHGVNEIDFSLFTSDIGYPIYIRDESAYFVVKITSIFVFFGFRSYIAATILMAWVSFFGVWRLYRIFVDAFPNLSKELAISVFFMPSVFFWGSGILKDSITFSAIGFFVTSFNKVFIQRKSVLSNILIIIIASNIIIMIKPYILIGMMPGCLLWIVMGYAERVTGSMKKALIIPVFFIFIFGFGYLMIYLMQGSLGQYSSDNLVYKAVETQKDLKSDYYQGNSFDIGEYEPTLFGIMKKAPIAIFTCIFRPSLFEANNIVMFVSAIENTFIFFITLRMLIRVKVLGFFKYTMRNALLTFSLIFTLFFSFSVGFSTSNFGSLVRYKIPIIPFFIASVYIIDYMAKRDRKNAIEKVELYTPVGV